MADSAFWRKLAKKFRELPRESAALIFGEKYSIVSDKHDWTWRLSGKKTLRVNFEALARRAALALPDLPHTDLLTAWLESLVSRGSAEFNNQTVGTSRIGDTTIRSTTGTLYELPRHSADLCKILESEALQNEAYALFAAAPKRAAKVIPPEAPKTPSVAEQIKQLRKECKWTIPRLAAKVGLDETTVKRHLSGKQTPHFSNVICYQKAFSQALKREIVIS
jgi:DNA-binding XRE family transcriptional regulator